MQRCFSRRIVKTHIKLTIDSCGAVSGKAAQRDYQRGGDREEIGAAASDRAVTSQAGACSRAEEQPYTSAQAVEMVRSEARCGDSRMRGKSVGWSPSGAQRDDAVRANAATAILRASNRAFLWLSFEI